MLSLSSPAGPRTRNREKSMNFRKQNLKRILGLLAFSALLVGSTNAQARGPGRGGCEAFLSQIELDEAQQADIDLIREGARDQREQIFANEDLSREDKRAALQTVRESTQELILKVLTPEQQAEIEQLKEERAAAHLTKRIERLTERLELSTDQADQIRVIFETARPEMEAIKDSDATREEKHEQFEALKTQINASIVEEVLSVEQAATFTEMMERRGNRGRGGRRNRRG